MNRARAGVRRRWPQTPRSLPSSERGAVAAVVAVSLIGLMALSALAVDMTLLLNWRGKDQNAADHAALAAADAYCTGVGDPATVAYASALDNGFDNDGTTNSVSVNDLGSGRWEVIVRSRAGAIFGNVIQVTQLDAAARAVAGCTSPSPENYSIFAGSLVCEKTIDWPGSTTSVTGAVHTNNDFYMGGSINSIGGDTSYVTTSFVNAGNAVLPPPVQVPVRPYPPGDFDIADYQPGGDMAELADSASQYYDAGSSKIDLGWLESRGLFDPATGALDEGLYVTSGDIDLGPSDMNGKVTFVTSGGTISITGSSQNLEPWDPRFLLAYSDLDTKCGDFAIKISGGSSSWTGLLYAPLGLVEMSGSDNSTFTGTIIGDTVRLNGSQLQISPLLDCCDGEGVFLLE